MSKINNLQRVALTEDFSEGLLNLRFLVTAGNWEAWCRESWLAANRRLVKSTLYSLCSQCAPNQTFRSGRCGRISELLACPLSIVIINER